MQLSNSTLILRRNRRILRSKVYLVLKNNQKEKDFDVLKASLNNTELKEVIEDPCYYVPCPETLKSIKENTQTIEEILDNNTKAKIPPPKPEKKRKMFRKATEMKPFQRNPSLLSQKTLDKFPVIKKRETVNIRDQIAKSLIRKIDLTKSLLDMPIEKSSKKPTEKMNTYLKFDQVFRDLENNYHKKIQKKYKDEALRKNKTRAWANSVLLNQSFNPMGSQFF